MMICMIVCHLLDFFNLLLDKVLEPLGKKSRPNNFHSPTMFPTLNSLSNMHSVMPTDSNTQFNNAIMEQLMQSAAAAANFSAPPEPHPQPIITKCWIKQKTSKSVYKVFNFFYCI